MNTTIQYWNKETPSQRQECVGESQKRSNSFWTISDKKDKKSQKQDLKSRKENITHREGESRTRNTNENTFAMRTSSGGALNQ